MAKHGFFAYVNTTSPAATRYDGDIVYALSTGQKKFKLDNIGFPLRVEQVMQEAILNAVRSADPLPNLPSAKNFPYNGVSAGRGSP
jgi:L-aminopeptidase/D-esterase-like protein